MEYIAHRINTIEELKKLPAAYGAEVDLRDDFEHKIYLSHDPYERGESFEEYLKAYRHGTMILNIKSERIEPQVLDLLKKYGITKYFFLDSSFPMIHLLSSRGEKNIALRISEYEGLDTVRNMRGRVKWVWVDCFHKIPVTKREMDELKSMGYSLCIVSPELQGRSGEVKKFKDFLKENDMHFDAVCTKAYNIGVWAGTSSRHN